MAKWRFDPVNIGFCSNHCAVQGAGGRGPADAPVSAHVWRLPAEHRRQVLPEGHRAVLARGLPELWPVRLSPRGGGPPALLQAGKKAVSERLPQVGVRSKTSGFHPGFAWGTFESFLKEATIFFLSSQYSRWCLPQAFRSGRPLCFLREEDPSVWDDDARSGQGLPSGVFQMRRLSEALLRGRPLPAHQLRHCVWAGHLRVDQTQQQQHRLVKLSWNWRWTGRRFKGLPVACACWWWLHQQ